jgi:dephospho-CoA kinase
MLVSAVGVPPATWASATRNAARGRVTLLALSGRLGSGKDTIGRLVMASLARRAVRLSFGGAIRAEGDRLIGLVARATAPDEAAWAAAEAFGVPPEDAGRTVEHLWGAVHADGLATTASRHPAVRRALEHWGAVRRESDTLHWIRPVVVAAAEYAARGWSCSVTDVRRCAEADWLKAAGFVVVRVEASERARRRRVLARDGAWDAATARSALEAELDGAAVFDLSVTNERDGDLARAVAAVRALVAGTAAGAAA